MSDTEIRDWIARYGARILAMMFADAPPPADVRARRISASADCMVLKVEAGGRAAAIKAFRDSATPAFDRELAMLMVLGPSGLAPRLRGYSKADRMIVMDWVAGDTLASRLTPETLPGLAGQAGRWLAAFTGVTKRTPADTDWFSYLSQYDAFAADAALAEHAPFLRQLPIRTRAIAKNDGFLANFIVRHDGGLTGLDFEAASVKPLGWDVLLTARSLQREHPACAADATRALLRGWGQGTDSVGAADFARLTRLFADKTMHLGDPAPAPKRP
jgi:hypothetical protein